MNEVLSVTATVAKLGPPVALLGLFVYVVLRGELRVRYPAPRGTPGTTTTQ